MERLQDKLVPVTAVINKLVLLALDYCKNVCYSSS